MFTHTTRVAFNNLIAARLGDAGKVYWTNSQINAIIDEALLTFGAIAAYWKDEVTIETTNFDSVDDKLFYDLLVDADVNEGFEHTRIDFTYEQILSWLDADLVDFSELATQAELIELISDAINKFQSATKLVLGRQQFNIHVGERIEISDDVLDIVSAYYIDSSAKRWPLKIVDETRFHLQNLNFVETNQRPRYYSINNVSLKVVDLWPRPAENGFLELIYIKGVTEEADEDSSIVIPNNLAPYLKYKVEADIFAKDDNFDPFRAAYCMQRWGEGLLIGSNYTSTTNSKIDGVNRIPSSLHDFDNLRFGWFNEFENEVKKINALALAGYNIVAVNRKPIFTHSLRFEVVANAPISSEYIDVRSDFLPMLLDYCLHIAVIRDGIAAIEKTKSSLSNFVKTSAQHNVYLQNRRISYLDLLQKSKAPLRQAKIAEEDAA